MLRQNETVKLHYNKYLYKVKLTNPLATIFRTDMQRGGKLSYAKKKLNEYRIQANDGQVLRRGFYIDTVLTEEDIDNAEYIYKTLRYAKDYLVRVEYNTLNVYSNNIKFLQKFEKVSSHIELWAPKPENIDFLKKHKHKVIVDTVPDLPFKVTFGRKRAKVELGTWLSANSDKSKAGNTFIDNCLNESWINGQYVFARDEKVLFLINMIAGDNITKIEELVCRT